MATPVKPDKGETSMSYNFAAKIEQIKKPKPTNLEAWIASLDAEDRAALEAVRFDDEVTNVALHALLTDSGARIGEKPLAKWRRGRAQ